MKDIEILKMAMNGDVMYYLEEIKIEKNNVTLKSEVKIKKLISYIQEIMEDEK